MMSAHVRSVNCPKGKAKSSKDAELGDAENTNFGSDEKNEARTSDSGASSYGIANNITTKSPPDLCGRATISAVSLHMGHWFFRFEMRLHHDLFSELLRCTKELQLRSQTLPRP